MSQSVIKHAQLAHLRALRDTIAKATNHAKAERLRKQREAEITASLERAAQRRADAREQELQRALGMGKGKYSVPLISAAADFLAGPLCRALLRMLADLT